MIVKAIELAEEGEGVLFMVFVDGRWHGSDEKTLLCLDLVEKFKNHPQINVQMIPFLDGKTNNLKGMHIHVVWFVSNKGFYSILM